MLSGSSRLLLELRIGKFAAQIGTLAFLVFLLLLGFLLQGDDQLVVLVDVDFEIFTSHARSGDLHLVLVFVFDDVDGRSRRRCGVRRASCYPEIR